MSRVASSLDAAPAVRCQRALWLGVARPKALLFQQLLRTTVTKALLPLQQAAACAPVSRQVRASGQARAAVLQEQTQSAREPEESASVQARPAGSALSQAAAQAPALHGRLRAEVEPLEAKQQEAKQPEVLQRSTLAQPTSVRSVAAQGAAQVPSVERYR